MDQASSLRCLSPPLIKPQYQTCRCQYARTTMISSPRIISLPISIRNLFWHCRFRPRQGDTPIPREP